VITTRTAETLTIRSASGSVTVVLQPRDMGNPHGPRHGSIATIRLDAAAVAVPMPASADSDGGGPNDRAWAAYHKAELDAMHAVLAIVLPAVRDRSDNGIIPGTWTPSRNAGCSMCPCTPGLVGDTKITIGGHVTDLHITGPINEAAILAALPLRPRPGLYTEPAQGKVGTFLILEEPSDPEHQGADAIIGLAVPGILGGWYLGCITCQAEINEADSGMCLPCRQDEAWHDEQRRASQEDWVQDW
jgi:hypothetical protein